MKNLFILKKGLGIFLFLFLIISCSQTDLESSETLETETELKISDDISLLELDLQNSSRSLILDVVVSCSGNCDGGNSECYVSFNHNYPDRHECSCEGCSMVFDYNEKSIQTNNIKAAGSFNRYFSEYLKNLELKSPVVLIDNIHIQEYSDVTFITYEFLKNDVLESVSFLQKRGEGKSFGPVIVVNCSGGCNSAGATCRERFFPATGAVECTCEGSCEMTTETKE